MTEKNDFTIDNPIMYDKENGRCRCIPIPYEKDMAEKRFENRLDLLNPKFNTLNPVWDNEKGDALNVFEMIGELNYLNDCCNNLIDDNTEYVAEINQMHKENEQLKHNNKMLSMKMSEVYTKYCLLNEFSEDTNPNDAVKRILSELMQITKEYR